MTGGERLQNQSTGLTLRRRQSVRMIETFACPSIMDSYQDRRTLYLFQIRLLHANVVEKNACSYHVSGESPWLPLVAPLRVPSVTPSRLHDRYLCVRDSQMKHWEGKWRSTATTNAILSPTYSCDRSTSIASRFDRPVAETPIKHPYRSYLSGAWISWNCQSYPSLRSMMPASFVSGPAEARVPTRSGVLIRLVALPYNPMLHIRSSGSHILSVLTHSVVAMTSPRDPDVCTMCCRLPSQHGLSYFICLVSPIGHTLFLPPCLVVYVEAFDCKIHRFKVQDTMHDPIRY